MNKQQLLALRQQAHHLKPVVILGAQGLTPAVGKEIDVALQAHELIKIKINALDRAEFKQLANTICENHQATLVDLIGHIAIIYRPRPD